MKKEIMAGVLALAACATPVSTVMASNPFLTPYTTKYGIPPFEQIKTTDFIPAIKAGLEEQKKNLEKITSNPAKPDFDNTILPLENLSPVLDRVAGVFYHYDGAMNTEEFAAMADEAIPLLNEAGNMVNLDEKLFKRIQSVYENRNKMKLTPVQKRLVEKYYRQFAEQGAALTEDKKKELVRVNDELSKLFIQFNRNLLNATNSFFVTVYDKNDLAGLPSPASRPPPTRRRPAASTGCGCSPSTPRAVCRCSSMPTTVAFARPSIRVTQPSPPSATTTTTLSSRRL